MDEITNHAETALGYVLSQFDDSPRLRKLVEIIADQIQILEGLAHDVWSKRFLDEAEGVILDVFGKIVQVERLGDSDDDYRQIVAAAIAANMSTTHGDVIAAIASALVGRPVRYRWDGPMNINLEYETLTPVSASHAIRAKQLLDRAVGGGVSWRLTEGVLGEAFRYGIGPGFGTGRLGRIVTRG